MPPRKYTKRKTARKRKTAWYDKKYSTYQLAMKALQATKYLKSLVNSEMFNIDRSVSLGSNQSNIYNLTPISQGDGQSGRTGNSILVKSIYLRGYAIINSGVTAATRVAICIVQDNQQVSSTDPTVTSIFTSQAPEAMLNAQNSGRFSILCRKEYTLAPVTAGNPSRSFNIYKPMQHHVRFNGAGSANIAKGGLYLVILTSEPANYPSVDINTRVQYHDN